MGKNKQKMKKFTIRYVVASLLYFAAFFIFTPTTSQAAGLVPCGGRGESPCTLCHFVVGMQGLIKWGMGVAIIAGIAAITIAGAMYVVSAGNTGMIDKAKSAMKNVVIGLVVMVSAWLIINYGMLLLGAKSGLVGTWYKFDATCTVNVGSQANYSQGTTSGAPNTISLQGQNCSDADSMKARLSSGTSSGVVCTGQCPSGFSKVLSDYATQINQYAPQVNLAGASLDQKKKLLAAIIFKESSGNPNAKNEFACGLMQTTYNEWSNVNDCYNPDLNIQKGVSILNSKLSAAPASFGSTDITKLQMALAMYNCCGTGPNPNTPSNDCTVANGWTSVPQWACPISAGEMCGVRKYVCDISACVE